MLRIDTRNNRKKYLLLTLYVVYITDSLLFATTGNYNIFGLMSRLSPLVLIVIWTFHDRIITLPRMDIFVIASIVISALLCHSISSTAFYLSQIILIVFARLLSHRISFERFVYYFIKIMKIIAIVSLIGFVFSSFFVSLGFIPTLKNTAGNQFKFLFFTNIPIRGVSARRNWGPFWEPGCFQYYINMATLFSLFFQQKTWKFDVTLFVLTTMTTLSGASILPLPFIVLAYLFSQSENRKGKMSSLIFVAIITVAFCYAIGTGYFDEIINKVVGTGDVVSKSAGYRVGTMLGNMKAAIMHPLFGATPSVQEEIRRETIHSLNGVFSQGNVNTITGYFSYYGVIVGTYFTRKIYRITGLINANTLSRIFAFIAIVIMTSNENLMQSMLLIVLMYMNGESLVVDEGPSYEKSKQHG